MGTWIYAVPTPTRASPSGQDRRCGPQIDVLVAWNGAPLHTVGDFAVASMTLAAGDALLLTFRRTVTVALPAGRARPPQGPT